MTDKNLLDLASQYAPIIATFALVLLPSIITGLTPYPKASGVVSVLQTVLSFLSWATHKDSAGTFKVPLMPAAPPPDGVPEARSAAQDTSRGFTDVRLGLVLALALMASTFACAYFKSSFKTDLAACGTEALKTGAGDLLPAVAAILGGGTVNWEAQLVALEGQFGSAAICAVHAFLNDFQLPQTPLTPDAGVPVAVADVSTFGAASPLGYRTQGMQQQQQALERPAAPEAKARARAFLGKYASP